MPHTDAAPERRQPSSLKTGEVVETRLAKKIAMIRGDVGKIPHHSRRSIIGRTAASLVAAEIGLLTFAKAASPERGSSFRANKSVKAGVLNVGYLEAGPVDGPPVLLLHGFPYSIESYIDVVPVLVHRGCRVIVPFLRGHGATVFLDAGTPRSGQQAALGVDVVAFMDALGIPRAVLAGYDWGGRAACVVAALWPDRCKGLVSVNSYLIQDISKANVPLPPSIEAGLWYQFYFQTERGRAGLTADRNGIARTLWARNSPNWRFADDTFHRHASGFDNPDYVDVVIHSYRHRLGLAPGFSAYEDVETRLARLPVIPVSAITMDGDADGVVPATDGRSTAARFTGGRQHRVIRNAGHNLPEEAPAEFADAVWELVRS
jgi:pimeloyl-ACP methyl ester carboxylesterase